MEGDVKTNPWEDMYEQIADEAGHVGFKKQILRMLKEGCDIVDIGEFWEKSGRKTSDFFAFLNGLDEAERSFCRKE